MFDNSSEIVYVGIDVGKSNGSMTLMQENKEVMFTFRTEFFKDAMELLVNSNNNELVIYVEKLWGRPGNSIHSTWGMAEEYGRIKGILESMGLEYVLVAPMIWQKMYKRNYGLKSSKIYSERKENLFNVCKKVFPEHKMFKYAADSILICNYAIDTELNKQMNLGIKVQEKKKKIKNLTKEK